MTTPPDLPRDPAELATPAGTARVLRAFGLRPRKRLGQHFLVSRRVLDRLLAEADLSAGERVLEAGAGIGTLTANLAARGVEVVAVEVDAALIPALRAVTAPYPTVRLVHGDIMALDLRELVGEATVKVVSNLPYGIASPLLVRLLEELPRLTRMVVTVQAEVAARLAASPGTAAYGALSLLVQYRAQAQIVLRVPPGAFYPPPEVDSAVVRLDARPGVAARVRDEALLFALVKAAFAQRRKVLRNALAGVRPGVTSEVVERVCRAEGIDPRRRGETLSLEEFARLADAVAARLDEAGAGDGEPQRGS